MWQEHGRVRLHGQPVVTDIADHPDDLGRGLIRPDHRNPAAQGTAVWKVPPDERLVDDNDAGTSQAVAPVEGSAAKNGDPHRVEVATADERARRGQTAGFIAGRRPSGPETRA